MRWVHGQRFRSRGPGRILVVPVRRRQASNHAAGCLRSGAEEECLSAISQPETAHARFAFACGLVAVLGSIVRARWL